MKPLVLTLAALVCSLPAFAQTASPAGRHEKFGAPQGESAHAASLTCSMSAPTADDSFVHQKFGILPPHSPLTSSTDRSQLETPPAVERGRSARSARVGRRPRSRWRLPHRLEAR